MYLNLMFLAYPLSVGWHGALQLGQECRQAFLMWTVLMN